MAQLNRMHNHGQHNTHSRHTGTINVSILHQLATLFAKSQPAGGTTDERVGSVCTRMLAREPTAKINKQINKV